MDALNHYIYTICLFQCHLIEQVRCTADTVDNEEHVADIYRDITADRGVELHIAHCRTPRTVEVDTDQFALAVDNGRARVTARGVVRSQETYRNLLLAIDLLRPTAIILLGIDVTQNLRDVVVIDVGIVLGHNAVDG